MAGLRLVVVGKEPKLIKSIVEVLKPLGYLIVGSAGDSINAVKIIRVTQPDLVIIDGELEFLEVAKTIDESLLAPMLLLVDNNFWNTAGSVIEQWQFDYLEKPITAERLNMALTITVEKYEIRFRENLAQGNLKSAATPRNMVNKARELLAKSLGITESQALNRILILSHQRKMSVRDMARKIMRNVDSAGGNFQLRGII